VDMEALLRDPEMQAAMHGVRAKIRAFRTSRTLMLQQFDEMWDVAKRVRPDAIVYHPKAVPAPYLARALGVAAIPSFLQPAFRPSRAFPNPLLGVRGIGPGGNRLSGAAMIRLMRLGHGALLKGWLPRHGDVPQAPALDVLAGYDPHGQMPPRLYAHSACLVPKPADWGAEDHVTGDWHEAAVPPWSPPADLVAFLDAGPPPVHVGFGSMPAQDGAKITDTVLAALKRTGQRAILSVGWGGLEARENTDFVHFLAHVSHDWLFPRCRAVVHHGGAGTTHAGLRHGRPTLVCPHFGDQPFWGRRVAAIGAGPNPAPVRSLTVESLAGALQDHDGSAVAKAAHGVARYMALETGPATAAALVEHALAA
ncbi:MAG: glycosyltransferase, partial [Shimia sp.]